MKLQCWEIEKYHHVRWELNQKYMGMHNGSFVSLWRCTLLFNIGDYIWDFLSHGYYEWHLNRVAVPKYWSINCIFCNFATLAFPTFQNYWIIPYWKLLGSRLMVQASIRKFQENQCNGKLKKPWTIQETVNLLSPVILLIKGYLITIDSLHL